MAFVPTELVLMPLSRWNESVFRYFYCRALAEAHPEVKQLVECDRIDLVLHHGTEKAFVEFKFYLQPRRINPYTGGWSGFKGGPGTQNLNEFRQCITTLHARAFVPGLSKYIVLVYADPNEGTSPGRQYSIHYDSYVHSDENIAVHMLESHGPIESHDSRILAKLFAVR
jgi:hypothetical protein